MSITCMHAVGQPPALTLCSQDATDATAQRVAARHAILHNSVLLQHITTSLCVVDVLLHPCYLCMLVRQDTCMLATTT